MEQAPLTMLDEDEVLQHVKALARANDPEPEHCFQVTRVAAMLFAATQDCHGLGADELRLLLAAALLHDTGYAVDPQSHHKRSRDFIMGADLPGVTETNRKIIACIARYHRGGHPKPDQKVYADLSPPDQRRVAQIAAILRIADGLDRAHDASCRNLEARREDNVLTIDVNQRTPSEIDLAGADRKKGLFEEVFGVAVRIEGRAG